jgi:predicted nucleic acid-binding protein
VNVLVDTSVWSLALRRKPRELSAAEQPVVEELADLTREGRARIIGLIRQELLSGIKTAAQYEKLRVALRAFPDDEIDTSDYEAAAKASNDCRLRGIAASVVDALICHIALARQWSIFTTDSDFKAYARVLPIKLHEPRAVRNQGRSLGGAAV